MKPAETHTKMISYMQTGSHDYVTAHKPPSSGLKTPSLIRPDGATGPGPL